uniref:Uncharacterized protein n=1 Tax=Oryza sativa subsp. japonica TaxID=39947 RepID=Q5VN66_ORYSJ|nr:hypothetical protein [Oryza sativa Japonica Group]
MAEKQYQHIHAFLHGAPNCSFDKAIYKGGPLVQPHRKMKNGHQSIARIGKSIFVCSDAGALDKGGGDGGIDGGGGIGGRGGGGIGGHPGCIGARHQRTASMDAAAAEQIRLRPPRGRPDPSPATVGRPDPSPAAAGRPNPSPAAAGRPDPSPAAAGRPDPSPAATGRPDPSPATAGTTAVVTGDDDGGGSDIDDGPQARQRRRWWWRRRRWLR